MENTHMCSCVVCVCVNTPAQGEKWLRSLHRSKDSCQCEEPFCRFETLNQTGYIPETDRQADRQGVDSIVQVSSWRCASVDQDYNDII